MAGRIVLFGATGYTGGLAAAALVERGARPVLAARNRDRLEALATELGQGLETEVADVARPQTIRELLEPGDVMLSTVGPFARYGAPAIEAAIDAGATYLDSTGEPAFIRDVFEAWGPRAERSGSALLTAMGYDWVPGNLAGALAVEEAGTAASRLEIGYFLSGRGGGFSGGTSASSAGASLEPAHAYRRGTLVREPMAARVHGFEIGGRERQAISTGSTEPFSLPRLYPQLTDVLVYLGWFGAASRVVQAASLSLSVATKVPGVRGGLAALIGRLTSGSTGGPGPSERATGGSDIVAIASDVAGSPIAEIRLSGPSAYDFTAGMLAWSTIRAAHGQIEGTGALGPVEAFGLAALRDGCEAAGLDPA